MAKNALTYVAFADIIKVEKSEDGQSIKVFGKATDETLDGDGQKVDLAWASKALERWLGSGGNIRVQHNPNLYPAGVGIELDVKSDGAYVTADIVEPTAMRLVEKGALRAFSIGISNPKIVRDATAPHGRINGGEIPELSIVDRPSNPSCGVKVMKGGDGEFAMDTWDSGFIAKDDSSSASDDIEAGNGDTDSDCSTCGGTGKIRDGHRNCPDCNSDGSKNKSADDDAAKIADTKKAKKEAKKQHGNDKLGGIVRSLDVNVEDGKGQRSDKALDGAHGEGSEHTDKSGDETSDTPQNQSVQVEKLDLTGNTQPVVTEVEKRDRAANGQWSTRSNPGLSHDPNHHDSTDPHVLSGGDEYAGQSDGTTSQGDVADTAVAVETVRADPSHNTLPVTLPLAASQVVPPTPVEKALRKANKKANKKLRKQAKLIKQLQKQATAKTTPVEEPANDVQAKYNELVTKAKADADRIATLEGKIEKISSQPTLGKAIRAPQSVHVAKDSSTAEAQQRVVDDELRRREAFLEGVAQSGNPSEQEAAQDMLRKMRTATINK